MQLMKNCIFLAIFPALLASAPINAGVEKAPDKTSEFVLYCADAAHFKACRTAVVKADIILLSEESCAEYGTRGIGNDEATRAILGWLAKHPEVHALSTEKALIKAITTLWPCQ